MAYNQTVTACNKHLHVLIIVYVREALSSFNEKINPPRKWHPDKIFLLVVRSTNSFIKLLVCQPELQFRNVITLKLKCVYEVKIFQTYWQNISRHFGISTSLNEKCPPPPSQNRTQFCLWFCLYFPLYTFITFIIIIVYLLRKSSTNHYTVWMVGKRPHHTTPTSSCRQL